MWRTSGIFDKLRLVVIVHEEPEREREVVDVFINNRRLIDMVREVELPFARNEGNPEIAGGYLGLPPEAVFLPGRGFLDNPDEWYGQEGKSAVLGCECGEPGCWPFLVKIKLETDRVIWDGFEQPYRKKWKYDKLEPFVFDREQYENQLGARIE